MALTAEQIWTDVLKLNEDARFEIAEALLASTYQDHALPLDADLLALIEKRVAELESGAVAPVPWEEVRGRIRTITAQSRAITPSDAEVPGMSPEVDPMGLEAERLLADALTLAEEDRFELSEALTASIAQGKGAPAAEFLDRIRRRCDEIDSGSVTLISWEEVKRRTRGAIRG